MADQHPEYTYAPDRFDREAESTSFHGAHRAEEAFWRQNLLYILIIAAAVVLLLVLLFVIGGMSGGKDSSSGTATTPTTQSAAPASDGGGAAAASQGDRSTPVLVVNAGGQKGMAGTWKKTLGDKGWTHVDIQTAKTRQEKPVVFYRDEKDAASAKLVAQDAGIDGAQQSDDYDARITVIVVNPPQG